MDKNNNKYFDERDLGLKFVNCDAEWYINSLTDAISNDCIHFPCSVDFKSTYNEEVGIDENNADVPKGVQYIFPHFIINSNDMWLQPETDQTEYVNITYITNYSENYSVLIRRTDMALPGFKRFLRDRILFTLAFFNKSNFPMNKTLENIKSYIDLMTLVCFCNKYRNTLSICIGNIEDEISKFFRYEYVVMHTRCIDVYKLELIRLAPCTIADSYSFNINYEKKKLDYHIGEKVQNAYGKNHAKAAASCEAMYEPEKAPAPAKPKEEEKDDGGESDGNGNVVYCDKKDDKEHTPLKAMYNENKPEPTPPNEKPEKLQALDEIYHLLEDEDCALYKIEKEIEELRRRSISFSLEESEEYSKLMEKFFNHDIFIIAKTLESMYNDSIEDGRKASHMVYTRLYRVIEEFIEFAVSARIYASALGIVSITLKHDLDEYGKISIVIENC